MINELHMTINIRKTKVLICSRNNYTRVKLYLQGNHKLEQVEDFTYFKNVQVHMDRVKNK